MFAELFDVSPAAVPKEREFSFVDEQGVSDSSDAFFVSQSIYVRFADAKKFP